MRKVRILLLIFFLVVFAIFMATTIREYLTSDYEAPVISADTDVLYKSVDAKDDELLIGLTASDNLDGDVTDTIALVSKSKFVSKGVRNVNYAAFDENNNVGTYMRKLVYTDYHSPRFVLSEPMRFVAGNSSYNYLRNMTAVDCLDGNLSSQIKITFGEKVTSSEFASTQKVNVQVTNSAGDTSTLELDVTFEDFESYSKASPSLTDYIIYVTVGEKPNYRAYLNGIWTAGNTRKFSDLGFDPDTDVSINDTKVDYSRPGVYEVIYQLTRAIVGADKGTYTTEFGTAKLIVVVEDKQ